MKNYILIFFSIVLIYPQLWAEDAGQKDCSCPVVSCGPCQKKVTVGKEVKFCDWGDINVCKKVVCENVSQYFQCLSSKNKDKSPEKEEGDLEFVYEKGQKVEKQKRKVASDSIKTKRPDKVLLQTEGRIEVPNDSRIIPHKEYSDKKIGEIVSVDKGLQVFHRGKMQAAKKGQSLYVDDELINKGKVRSLEVRFESGKSQFKLFEKSKMIVHDPHSMLGRFQPFFYLVYGKVDVKADLNQGSVDVLAGQILVRAQKAHHLVGYEMAPEGLMVKVEAYSDAIEVIKANDLSGKTIPVMAGNFVSWVSETSAELFSMDEKRALADQGYITPVYEMPLEQKKQLGLVPEPPKALLADWTRDEKRGGGKNRQPASFENGMDLCQQPAARFQQCVWSCENNPKGAKNCMAQEKNVHCVRRVCNAAGQWGVPTAFASSYSDLCPAQGERVGDCNP